MEQKYFTYSGVIHIHSTYSDGSKSIPEIAAIANELDIDYMLMTDHNTLQPRLDGLEGWYGRVLVGIGSELNDREDKNHYLAFNISRPIDVTVSAEDYVCAVRKQGGIGFMAHPFEQRSVMPEYPPYPWTLWDNECFDGMELWNHMSEWMEGLTHKNKYLRALHPRRSILSPKLQTLERWDELNQVRKVVGVGGVDAHGHIYRLFGFIPIRIFRYKISFRTIRTYVLTKNPLNREEDASVNLSRVYEALKAGRCFVAHRLMGAANSFQFWVEKKDGQATMGDSIPFCTGMRLKVRISEKAMIILIQDGREINRTDGDSADFPVVKPGITRVEVYKENRLWILSNHIRIIRD